MTASILVAEDEKYLCDYLTRTLTSLGYTFAGAVSSGEEAVERTGQLRPDLVLMDISLEGEMDGIEAADQIRARFDRPVVYLTVHAEGDVLELAKFTNPYGYLTKPISREALHCTIQIALYKHDIDRQVRENEEKYRLLFSKESDAVVLTDAESFQFLDVNEAAERLYGYTREEFLRMKAPDLSMPPEESEASRGTGPDIDGAPVTLRWHKKKDGTVFPVEISAGTFRWKGRQLVCSIIKDITQRYGYILSLEVKRNDFIRIAEKSVDGILVLDLPGTVLYANPSAISLFGVSESDLLASPFGLPLVPGQLAEVDIIRPDGEPGIAEMRLESTHWRGDPAHLVLLRDITELKTAQALHLQACRFKAVADLAAGVAHNFNNLLQIIVGGAELALIDLEMGDYSDVKRCLKQVVSTSRFGAETVRRLQSFVGVRTEVSCPPDEVFDLSDVIRQVAEVTEPWLKLEAEREGRNVSLQLKLSPGCLIKGKGHEIFEVVLNLIKNATEALPQGGQIYVETFVQNDQAILKIRDTGIGISEENLARLFNPFFTSKSQGGAGLGLAISRRIIDQHGGQILVESAEGIGTTFTVNFPLSEQFKMVKVTPRPRLSDQKLRILLIDDMEPLVNTLSQGLAEYNQTVVTALSGQEGIELFRNNRPDVVICDLGMPGMNGWQVGKTIREVCEQEGVAKPPFVILTGWGDQTSELGMIVESGVDAIVEKPIDLLKLLEVIKEATQPGE